MNNKNGNIGKEFETIDPRTEEVIAKIAEGAKEDIDVAVKAARVAFDDGTWPRMPGAVRYHFSLTFHIQILIAIFFLYIFINSFI